MTAPPYMPLYIADYLADTGHLSTFEHGAYLLLIMHYWRAGALPPDDKRLANIARCSVKQWLPIRATIAAFFDVNWESPRARRERDKVSARSAVCASNGAMGGRPKSLKTNEADKAEAFVSPKQDAKPDESKSKASRAPLSDIRHQIVDKKETNTALRASNELAQFAAEFYRAYPKKVDPKDCFRKFLATVKSGIDPQALINAARRYADACAAAGLDKQFIPAPAVWLNKGRYASEDLPAPVAAAAGKTNLRLQAAIDSQRDANERERHEPSRDPETLYLQFGGGQSAQPDASRPRFRDENRFGGD